MTCFCVGSCWAPCRWTCVTGSRWVCVHWTKVCVHWKPPFLGDLVFHILFAISKQPIRINFSVGFTLYDNFKTDRKRYITLVQPKYKSDVCAITCQNGGTMLTNLYLDFHTRSKSLSLYLLQKSKRWFTPLFMEWHYCVTLKVPWKPPYEHICGCF
jgi:hypothetical protein